MWLTLSIRNSRGYLHLVAGVVALALYGCGGGSSDSGGGTADSGDASAATYAAFTGSWTGKWGGVLDSSLVVGEVNNDGQAPVTYSWGDHPIGSFAAGSSQVTGRINDNTPFLGLGGGITARFQMQSNGTLAATYDNGSGEISTATFVKSRRPYELNNWGFRC